MKRKDIQPEIEPGRYRHFKGGDYEVIDVALDTENEDRWLVLYKKIGETMLFARPYDMFVENVSVGGEPVPRFTKIKDE